MSDKQNKFFQLFSSIRGKQAQAAGEKQARLTQRTVLEKNLNTMLSNGTLWGELAAASFLAEKAGEVVRRIKLDSAYDRFAGGLTFKENPHENFGKIFLPAIRSLATLVMHLALKDLRDAGETCPDFNMNEKADQQLALEIFGELYGFGTTLYKPPVKKIASEKYAAVESAAKAFLSEYFGK